MGEKAPAMLKSTPFGEPDRRVVKIWRPDELSQHVVNVYRKHKGKCIPL